MVDIPARLQALDLKWADDPIVRLRSGHSFVPRAGVFRDKECIAVICTFPNYAMERGLTTDITNAQNIVSAETLIHLRPQANSSFVGTRSCGSAPVYAYEPETVVIGGEAFLISDLCALLPTDNRSGWNDSPLGGSELPCFGDMKSFLCWWDFHPGKQSFEIIDGQVHLAQGFLWRSAVRPGFRGDFLAAARSLRINDLGVYSRLLVRTDPLTAICPDLVFCVPPKSDGPFVDAKACVLFIRPGWSDEDVALRVNLLRKKGAQVAVLNAETLTFTDQFGCETKRFELNGHDLDLQGLVSEACA